MNSVEVPESLSLFSVFCLYSYYLFGLFMVIRRFDKGRAPGLHVFNLRSSNLCFIYIVLHFSGDLISISTVYKQVHVSQIIFHHLNFSVCAEVGLASKVISAPLFSSDLSLTCAITDSTTCGLARLGVPADTSQKGIAKVRHNMYIRVPYMSCSVRILILNVIATLYYLLQSTVR